MYRPFLTVTKTPSIATITRYAYLNTLVSALSGRLLSAEQLREFEEQSITDATALLRTAGLEEVSLEEMEDRSLEQVLVDTLVVEAQRLIRPLDSEAQELIRHWMRRFEIGNLKAVIRGKLTGRPDEEIRADFIDIGVLGALPLNTLMEAEDAQEMLRQLEGTPYGHIAHHVRSVQEERRAPSNQGEERELFLIEATIDREYFAGIEQRVNTIDTPDRDYLQPLVGHVIDQINLVWLLRYRFAYRLAPPLTYFLLCPGGHHLNSQHLLALVRAESFEETLRKVPVSLEPLVAEATSASEVEDRLGRQLLEVARFVLKRTHFNLGRALAYLLLREKELLHIYGVIKGRTLQFAPHLIHRAVWLTEENTSFRSSVAPKTLSSPVD